LPRSDVGLGRARIDDRLEIGRRGNELGRLDGAPEGARVQPGEAPARDVRREPARLCASGRIELDVIVAADEDAPAVGVRLPVAGEDDRAARERSGGRVSPGGGSVGIHHVDPGTRR
jgi:hypothetical protein